MTMAPGLQNFISSSPALTKATEELSENLTVTVAPKTFFEGARAGPAR